MKLLYSLLLLLVVKNSNAQEGDYVGKVDYVKERKLLSGEYVPRDNGNSETFFNSSSYTFIQKSLTDIDAMAEKFMKTRPKDLLSDSFEIARQKENIKRQLESQISQSTTGKTFVNFSNNVARKINRLDGDSYCVIDSLPKINWELKTDTMTMEGLLCQKARGFFIDKYYTVWFAPTVPFAAGPLHMHGLPGIIVLATSEDEKTRYRMKSLTYPLSSPIKMSGCNGEKEITKFNFNILQSKQIRAARENIEDLKKTHDKK
jgi:GLPGLI family protein